MRGIITSLRPRQWIKNFVIFAGIIFSRNTFDITMQAKVWLAFLCFCGVVGAGYIFNDYLDRQGDRLHSLKKLRPIASGSLMPQAALRSADKPPALESFSVRILPNQEPLRKTGRSGRTSDD